MVLGSDPMGPVSGSLKLTAVMGWFPGNSQDEPVEGRVLLLWQGA